LSSTSYQSVSVSCPKCRTRFVTPVLMTIDAATNPQAKALLLAGQLNIAACPQCGSAGPLSTPIVYHDAGKEILFTFVPAAMGGHDLERQRAVGDLTNRLISALPPEKRKGYLLNPRSFLQLDGMVEAILAADGITPEMLNAQRERAALLQRLVRAVDEPTRRAIARENDAQIGGDFFRLLEMNIDLVEANGQADGAQQLLALRGDLMEWTTTGRELAAREEAIASLGDEVTQERILDRLCEAALAGQDVKIETIVAVARPAIDYSFYIQLAARIEAAERAGKAEDGRVLRALREKVLDLTAQIDAEMQQAAQEAGQFLSSLMRSEDPEQEIRANPEKVDELFVGVLRSSLDAAAKAGHADTVQRLSRIEEVLARLVLEGQPPEVRLINELLSADGPQGSQAILDDHLDEVDDGLVEVMEALGQQLAESGRQDVADRLAEVRAQARAMIGSL